MAPVSQAPPGPEDAREPPPPAAVIPPGSAEPVIAVDAMGGDYAPDEIVAGALAAQREEGAGRLLDDLQAVPLLGGQPPLKDRLGHP